MKTKSWSFTEKTLIALTVLLVVFWIASIVAVFAEELDTAPIPTTTNTSDSPAASSPDDDLTPDAPVDLYYKNCNEARTAGVAPIWRGEPGYRPELDRNHDGVACE
jgi:hypothetical protein